MTDHQTTTHRPASPLPTEAAYLAAALVRMFIAFRERADDARTLAEVYMGELSALPARAAIEACGRFTRGQVERGTQAFAPSVAEICVEVERMQAREAEHERLTRPRLSAPTPEPDASPEERERVAAGLQRLADSMRRGEAAESLKAKQERDARAKYEHDRWEERRVEECIAKGIDPGQGISATLAAKLDEWKREAG